MSQSRRIKYEQLPVIVLDLPPRERTNPQSRSQKLLPPGEMNVRSAVLHYWKQRREYGLPNRYFPSIFGPGGISGGYADSNWV